jgi:hypothetical protein
MVENLEIQIKGLNHLNKTWFQATILTKKSPIWQYFCLLETDNSKATCHLCGSNLSLGSNKPKNQTTTNIKNHLKSKHLTEFTNFLHENLINVNYQY